MRTMLPLAVAALTLSACATTRTAAPAPAPAAALRITYDTGACFGTCPVYSVTVDTGSGAGEFIGTQHTAATGITRFQAAQAQAQAFADAVAELRKIDGEGIVPGSPRCSTLASDMPSVTVTWQAGSERTVKRVDYGCFDAANKALFARLRAAPGLLPIAALIGK
ncbi:hypothetical protein SAMN05216382_1862 [Sphingomonas palmae]|uniref:DUF6438 domain-containing protein n=1 Tax=Sphingomonas palmae TaxID=1855283 RepID=A0A1H7PIV5_9SPHN|nr:DUF6438 domain-containing protein [Sphingomonas palmae]SEL35549.1 hypothetical protein SAMN05216382_1862 [Sphingomonas palmae]